MQATNNQKAHKIKSRQRRKKFYNRYIDWQCQMYRISQVSRLIIVYRAHFTVQIKLEFDQILLSFSFVNSNYLFFISFYLFVYFIFENWKLFSTVVVMCRLILYIFPVCWQALTGLIFQSTGRVAVQTHLTVL